MEKKEIIELYLADLNNLVPDSEAKRSRIIDLEDELGALRKADVRYHLPHYFNAPDEDKSSRFCRCGKCLTDDVHLRQL